MTKAHLFVGSYTPSQNGKGVGISVRAIGVAGEVLAEERVTPLQSPAFLAVTPGRLFAVEEDPDGNVISFAREGSQLELISRVSVGGGLPCHITYDECNDQLLISNYLTGSLAVVTVNSDGSLGQARITSVPAGSGPVSNRQESPHPHQIIAASNQTEHGWLVSDLGTDRILQFRVEGGHHTPELTGRYELPPGAGPRHMAWSHGSLLVAGELDSQLHVMSSHGGLLVHSGSVMTVDPKSDQNLDAANFPSHLHVTADESIAYLANRGRNTISVFDLAELRTGGVPRLIQEAPCEGDWPRHFTFHDGRLYVANQGSHTIAVFEVNATDRRIGRLLQLVSTGSPMCLVIA